MTDHPLDKVRSLEGEAGRIWRELETAIDGQPARAESDGSPIRHAGIARYLEEVASGRQCAIYGCAEVGTGFTDAQWWVCAEHSKTDRRDG